MSWYKAAQVTATNGSNLVVVNSGEYINAIRSGDGLRITGFEEVEILETYTNEATDEEVIKLVENWPHASQSLVPATVLPRAVHFNTAAQALVDTKTKVFAQLASFFDFGTQASGTVTFNGVGVGTSDIVVKSIPQYKTELDALAASAGSSVADLAAVDNAINGTGGLVDVAAQVTTDLASVDIALQDYVSTTLTYRNSVSDWYDDIAIWHPAISGWHTDISGWKTASESARDSALQYRNEAEAFKNQAGSIVGGSYVDQSTKVNGKALTGDITLDANDIGLSNVDNTTDLDKPVSTATQAAIDAGIGSVDLSAIQAQIDKVRKLALAGL